MTLATLFLAALTAAWVQHPDATGPADDETVRFFRFRRDFEAKGPLEIAVTADERYVLFLDGKRIDRGPDRGSPDDWTCRTLRLSPADGTHRLEAVVWQVADAGPVAQLSCGRGGFALEAKGLLLCSEVCDTPGMICRGVGADGRCHYPLGSDDQTVPWFMGLDAYVRSGFCPDDLRARIVAKMSEVGLALEKTGWRLPCDGAFAGDFRGNLASGGLPFRASTHYLFVLRSLADVTGAARWKTAYVRARDERYPCDGLAETRLDVCAYGAAFDGERSPKKFALKPSRTWIYVCNVDCLAQLAAREEDPSAAARYREGLVRSAQAVRGFLAAAKDYPNTAERPFRYANWRAGWRWREQGTQKDAEAVAWQGNWDVLGTRKDLERRTLTTPLAAAAICAFAGTCGDEVDGVLAAYDYSTASISEFYLAPLAFETMERERKTR